MKTHLLNGLRILVILGIYFGAIQAGSIDTSGKKTCVTSGVANKASDVCPLKVGETIPKVKLSSINGKKIELTQLVKNKPTVIVFYRGGWCPYCNHQLRDLNKMEKQVTQLGFQVIAISPDQPKVANKASTEESFKYQIFSDSESEASRAFGLAFKVGKPMVKKLKEYKIDIEKAAGNKNHILPVPAVFLVDQKGVVHFQYANPDYKIRLKGSLLLAAAKSMLGK